MPSIAPEAMIVNLLHRYAELVDKGDFTGVGELFNRARVCMPGSPADFISGDAVGAIMRRSVRLYEGVPLTRHVVTNTIIEMADDKLTATTRSHIMVIQIVAAPEVIVIGRYHDQFACDGDTGEWYFTERIIVIDAAGDVSGHLTRPLPTNGEHQR